MKYTRLIYMSGIVLMLLSACSDSSSLDAEGQNGKPLQQTFTVAVESVGELFEGGEGVNPATVTSRRPISSVTPTQTFDLSIFINGSYGNKVMNYLGMQLTHMNSAWENQLNSVTGRARLEPIDPDKVYLAGQYWNDGVTNVRVSNPEAVIPRASIQDPNDNDRISDRYVEDGSYIRLKNITLGYTFPSKLIKKFGINILRFYANIQNLLTITGYDGYDPEIGASTQSTNVYGLDYGRYPSPTVYSFGLNVSF